MPAPQTPGVLVRPVPSTTGKPRSSTSQPRLASRLSACGVMMGRTNTADGEMTCPSVSSTPVRWSASTTSRAFAVDHADSSGVELGGLGRGRLLGVGEVDDVVGPLADELGVEDRARVGVLPSS